MRTGCKTAGLEQYARTSCGESYWEVCAKCAPSHASLAAAAGALERRGGRAQVDEPALREGLPLKRARWESYLTWAVRAFRLATVVAAPGTQVVTHLCYSEFADILHVRPGALPEHSNL